MDRVCSVSTAFVIPGAPFLKVRSAGRVMKISIKSPQLAGMPLHPSFLSNFRIGSGIGKSWEIAVLQRNRKNSKNTTLSESRCAYINEVEFDDEAVQPDKGGKKGNVKTKAFETPSDIKSKIDPVGILTGVPPLIAKPLAIFLRDRYKSYKVLKEKINEDDEDLLEFASGYEIFGMRRHPRHGIEVYEWAPGATFFSIVGDFNNWSKRANAMGKDYLGRDDYNHFRIFVEDELREGKEEDELTQEYNYMKDFDKGDEYRDMDAVFQQMNEEYWEPGEDEFMHKSLEDFAMEMYNEIFKNGNAASARGEEEKVEEDNEDESEDEDEEEEDDDNDAEDEVLDEEGTHDPEAYMKRFGASKEELDEIPGAEQGEDNGDIIDLDIPELKQGKRKNSLNDKLRMDDARSRYEKYKQSSDYIDHGLPPVDVIDDGTDYDDLNIVDDPAWRAKVHGKKKPLAYWELLVKGRKAWEAKYIPGIHHMGRYREHLHTPEGALERIPAYANYVLPDKEGTYSAIFWDPPPEGRHKWIHKRPPKPSTLRIYECHVGISGEDPRIATFGDFTSKVLPHVAKAGYNAIQLIGVQEHVEYSSVGYKVTNMFAVSSRFGTPEDFKLLVDTAHGMGLQVFLDIVHSYGAPNEMVGLAAFDGANDCFFYTGRRGQHKRWGTRMFRYSEYEVVRYLLSNLKWWVDEYHIDGFHFHSVSSMLYTHNGFSNFSNGLQDYCNQYVDKDAQIYLMLANEMLHQLNPDIVTIAEDVTMYPGLSLPLSQGGLGFDYYVNILPSELWTQLVESVRDEDWSMTKIVEALMPAENLGKALIYAENHNQSIVGGRSLAELLLKRSDRSWTKNSREGASSKGPRLTGNGNGRYNEENGSSARGVSLLKMIKLITLTLGGCAYLNFMGNEFGHPEWVEFPRSDNNFSYARARRQWSLLDDKGFHNKFANFDRALMDLEEDHKILGSGRVTVCHVDDSTKAIVYIRGQLLFMFNFHSTNYYEVYKVGVPQAGEYERLLATDQDEFGGTGETKKNNLSTARGSLDNFGNILTLQLPPRTAQVFRLARIWE